MELIKDIIPTENSQQTDSAENVNNQGNSNVLLNSNNSDLQQLIVLLCILLQSTGLSGDVLTNILLNNTNSQSLNGDNNTNNADNGSINNNNNNKISYECVKSAYQKYLENCDKVSEKAANGEYSAVYSQQLDTKEKAINVPLSTSYWTGQKEFDKWQNINLSEFDMDGDGKLTAADLKLLPEKLDLNDDGEISKDEETFLNKLKIHIYFNVRQQILSIRNKISNENIDEVISFLEFQENDELIQKTTKIAKSYVDKQGQGGKQFVNEDSYAWSVYGIPATSVQTVTGEYFKNVNKDLSKEELTEILNKINSASASVQAQLSEVKKVVEEKLETMS